MASEVGPVHRRLLEEPVPAEADQEELEALQADLGLEEREVQEGVVQEACTKVEQQRLVALLFRLSLCSHGTRESEVAKGSSILPLFQNGTW